MKRLTALQLDELKQALNRNHPHQVLQDELLDHLAVAIETQMNAGYPYALALHQAMEEASPQALAQLKHTYQQSLGFASTPLFSRRFSNHRYQQRQSASKQLPIWLGASAFTFVTLMLCMMWVGQQFSVPLTVFKLVWASGLISLFAVLSARFLFRSRSRSVRPVRT